MKILAVVRQTILMAARQKMPLLTVAVILLLLPFFTHFAQGDRTLTGALKSILWIQMSVSTWI